MKYIFNVIIPSIFIFILYTIPLWIVFNLVFEIDMEFWKCLVLMWVWYLFVFARAFITKAIEKRYFSHETNSWDLVLKNVKKRNGIKW